MPQGQTASNRSDIQLILSGLPEPIDLEIDSENQILYWTDRGEYPLGNTLNCADIGSLSMQKHGEVKPVILSRHLHEVCSPFPPFGYILFCPLRDTD